MVLVGKGATGRAHVPQMPPGPGCRHAPLEAFLRNGDQVPGPLVHAADFKHAGRVAVIPVHDRRHVDIHDIAVPQDHLGIRNTVADLVVDGGADALRKSAEAQGRRRTAVFTVN